MTLTRYLWALTRAALALCGAIFLASSAHAQAVHATGLKFVTPAEYAAIPAVALVQAAVPDTLSIDLTHLYPEPGNQGLQGSCVGWAVSNAKSFHENLDDQPRGAKAVRYSPAYIYNSIAIGGDCQAGSYIPAALERLKTKGIPPETEFPYTPSTCSALPSSSVDAIASRHRALAYKRLQTPFNPRHIQQLLFYTLPVIIGIDAYENFLRYSPADGTYDSVHGARVGGHALVIVGFDANRSAYKVLNSWGKDWGQSGYGWISVNVMATITREAYVIYDESSDNQSWALFQACMQRGGAACCGSIGESMILKTKGMVPGDLGMCELSDTTRLQLYSGCMARGEARCCDHLTTSLIKGVNVTACRSPASDAATPAPINDEIRVELFRGCKARGEPRCCDHLTSGLVRQLNDPLCTAR